MRVPFSCAMKIFFHILAVSSSVMMIESSALRSAWMIPLEMAVNEASMLVVKFCNVKLLEYNHSCFKVER
jgi:hypothetical protein